MKVSSEEDMSPEKRQKASDIFRQTEYLADAWGPRVSFASAFPGVASLRIDVEEHGDGAEWLPDRTVRIKHYTPDTLGEYIDCSNPLCHGGGFHVGAMLREAIYKHETEFKGTESCQGYEGSPKGRRKTQDCINYFKVHGAIQYKVPPDKSEEVEQVVGLG